MVRFVVAAALAAVTVISPAIASAQSEMSTYGDTLRKNAHAHSAVHPVQHGSVSAKHRLSGVKHGGKNKRGGR